MNLAPRVLYRVTAQNGPFFRTALRVPSPGTPSFPPSLARAAARPRIAGEMDSHAEVGDAADAAAERTDRTRGDAILSTRQFVTWRRGGESTINNIAFSDAP